EWGGVGRGEELVGRGGGPRNGRPGGGGREKEEPGEGGAGAPGERLGPPQQGHHRHRQRDGERKFPDEVRIDLYEEQERGNVDEHHVDEGGRHHEGAVLELRQRDQDDDQRERQRRRGQRAPQQNEPEKVERGPAEDE